MSLDNLLNVLGKAYYYIGLLLLGGGVAAVLLGVLLSRRSLVVPGLAGIFFGVRMVGGLAVQLGGTIVEEAIPAFKSTVFKLAFLALALPVLLGPSIIGMRLNGFTVMRWGIASFLFLGGFGVFAAGYMTYWKRSLVRDTSTSRVRSLAIGHVEVKGSVAGQDDERILAPLSGEQCLLMMVRGRCWSTQRMRSCISVAGSISRSRVVTGSRRRSGRHQSGPVHCGTENWNSCGTLKDRLIWSLLRWTI
ncbi:MAG: hypothetical protein SVU32_09645 [Candidatus Nanohaloarchaea archaeon]|nr:hypothetical protein [Candidatus Nanohaloarchaea archaeon]